VKESDQTFAPLDPEARAGERATNMGHAHIREHYQRKVPDLGGGRDFHGTATFGKRTPLHLETSLTEGLEKFNVA